MYGFFGLSPQLSAVPVLKSRKVVSVGVEFVAHTPIVS
jgi:hypothetical protein